MSETLTSVDAGTCFHCGEPVGDSNTHIADKHFCCEGCKTVYEIINKNGLCNYYDLTANPGVNQRNKVREGKFGFLDDISVQEKLIHFKDDKTNHVIFYLPQIHCSSCIWILEQLNKLDPGILKSQVNFLKKEITVTFDPKRSSLRKVAETLTLIGYEPHISLKDISGKDLNKQDRSNLIKLGLAGFCFANIMMLSFPEYFSSGKIDELNLKKLFNYLNLGLSLPVFFYSASGFFISAWKGIQQKFLNIDAPIALAILITFARSVYEILSFTGAGYLDSMSGIVFFMLIGRYFQNRTYQSISFDRDFTAYFPLGVTTLSDNGEEKQIPVSQLKKGDRIKIHHDEIIPADSILFLGKARIDYSFVSGESLPVEKVIGEIIYAGGKQTGGALELEVVKEVSQSYLTQLWNNDVFKEDREEKRSSFIHLVSKYFTIALFSIATISALYWSMNDPGKVWPAITSVLIVACPCALLLSATFTNGNMLRILSKHNFFIKNANVIERVSETDTIVFDKTGTITKQNESKIQFKGLELSDIQKQIIRSLANQSNHPLSRSIVSCLPFSKSLPVKDFKELKGYGVSGTIHKHKVKMGSGEFVFGKTNPILADGSRVYISIDDEFVGNFLVKNTYREGINRTVEELKSHYKLYVLSGDNNSEQQNLGQIFGKDTELLFEQKPEDKMNFISALQKKGRKIMMIGDGMNDAGALRQSEVGIAISDDMNNFSPACDAILSGENLAILNELIQYCKKEKTIIYLSFMLSILYNIIGLFYAVQGKLEPVIAAILMPVSSISIVLLTTGLSGLYGKKISVIKKN